MAYNPYEGEDARILDEDGGDAQELGGYEEVHSPHGILRREVPRTAVDPVGNRIVPVTDEADVLSGDFSRTSNPHLGGRSVIVVDARNASADNPNEIPRIEIPMSAIRANPGLVRNSRNFKKESAVSQQPRPQTPPPPQPGYYPQQAPPGYGPPPQPQYGSPPQQPQYAGYYPEPSQMMPEGAQVPGMQPSYPPQPPVQVPYGQPYQPQAADRMPSKKALFDIPNFGQWPVMYDDICIGEKSVMLVGAGVELAQNGVPILFIEPATGVSVHVMNMGLQHVRGGTPYLILPIVTPDELAEINKSAG